MFRDKEGRFIEPLYKQIYKSYISTQQVVIGVLFRCGARIFCIHLHLDKLQNIEFNELNDTNKGISC